MPVFYPRRRVPEAFPASHLFLRIAPLLWPIIRSSAWTIAANIAPKAGGIRSSIEETARERGNDVVEAAQRLYFEEPGLDTLTVREISKIGRTLSRLGHIYLWTRVATGTDRDHTARRDLTLIPSRGYDSALMAMLALGGALGYYTGGQVHSRLWWDSDAPDVQNLPRGHWIPAVRRFQPPRTLGDLAADIDDLYFAEAYGQAIKITRVGEGEHRRWLVSLPGTDHGTHRSEPNPADYEANIQEQLNIASAIRLGTVQTIHHAMSRDGIARAERIRERVLICGHSQGGMIAVALASMDPAVLGFSVDGVITEGSPTRRWQLRPEVQMLAVEHDQDIVPSLDGTPRRELDQRIVVRRQLVRPRRAALFYAHSSSTYTETLRRLERWESVVGWGKAGGVVEALRDYLPREGEPVRVTHHYTWQDLVEPITNNTWEEFLSIERPDWEPVAFGSDIIQEAEMPAVLERVSGALGTDKEKES